MNIKSRPWLKLSAIFIPCCFLLSFSELKASNENCETVNSGNSKEENCPEYAEINADLIGGISYEELLAYFPNCSQCFEMMDADANEMISEEEYEQFSAVACTNDPTDPNDPDPTDPDPTDPGCTNFDAVDQNGDGGLSTEEMSVIGCLGDCFTAADSNGDGMLSSEEYNSAFCE